MCLGWVKPFSWKNSGIFFFLNRHVTFLWVSAICLAVTCCGDIKGRGGVSHFEELVAIQFKEIAWNGKWFSEKNVATKNEEQVLNKLCVLSILNRERLKFINRFIHIFPAAENIISRRANYNSAQITH